MISLSPWYLPLLRKIIAQNNKELENKIKEETNKKMSGSIWEKSTTLRLTK